MSIGAFSWIESGWYFFASILSHELVTDPSTQVTRVSYAGSLQKVMFSP